MSVRFNPGGLPFPRWVGPYTPARGKKAGFKVLQGRLGAWVEEGDASSFWTIRTSPGAAQLERLVCKHWRGGGLAILPDGSIVKPDPDDGGVRHYLGQLEGDAVLLDPDGGEFCVTSPGRLAPGQVWPGPSGIGIECVLKADGSLETTWSSPAPFGTTSVSETVVSPNAALLAGFRAARPGQSSGRVRVVPGGHVITNRQVRGQWQCCYVGRIDVGQWLHDPNWIDAPKKAKPVQVQSHAAVAPPTHRVEIVREVVKRLAEQELEKTLLEPVTVVRPAAPQVAPRETVVASHPVAPRVQPESAAVAVVAPPAVQAEQPTVEIEQPTVEIEQPAVEPLPAVKAQGWWGWKWVRSFAAWNRRS